MVTVLCDATIVHADPMAAVSRAVGLARRVRLETVESSLRVERSITDDLTVRINRRSPRVGVANCRRHSWKRIPGE